MRGPQTHKPLEEPEFTRKAVRKTSRARPEESAGYVAVNFGIFFPGAQLSSKEFLTEYYLIVTSLVFFFGGEVLAGGAHSPLLEFPLVNVGANVLFSFEYFAIFSIV